MGNFEQPENIKKRTGDPSCPEVVTRARFIARNILSRRNSRSVGSSIREDTDRSDDDEINRSVSPSKVMSNMNTNSQSDDGCVVTITEAQIVLMQWRKMLSNHLTLPTMGQRRKKQINILFLFLFRVFKLNSENISAVVEKLATDIDSVANIFSENSNEEENLLRAEIEEIRNYLNATEKFVENKNSLLVQFISK